MQVTVRLTPGARKERVEIISGILHIAVTELASGNRANQRARELVARHFGVPQTQVRMQTGQRSRTKRFTVTMDTYQQ